MSKNITQNSPEQNSSIDIAMKTRYDQLLQAEKGKRPAWKDQTFSQKMDARLDGVASTYLAAVSPILAFTPYFFVAPLTFAMSANSAKKYDEKVNPEKYYEQKALEKLAIESGKLKRPGRKHTLFGGDILGGGIGDYGTKLNAAIAELAPKVGAPTGIKYTSPRDSLNDLNFVTRGVNGLVAIAGSVVSDIKKSFGRSFGSSSSQESTREEGPKSEKTDFEKMWNFLKKLFGLSSNNSQSSNNPYLSQSSNNPYLQSSAVEKEPVNENNISNSITTSTSSASMRPSTSISEASAEKAIQTKAIVQGRG